MNTTKNSERVCNHIKKRKLDLMSIFGGKCCICGFDKYPEALEFHHIDPATKEFSLMSSGNMTKSLEKQLKELKKCTLVCANCHRGIHAGYITLPEDVESLYNEQIAQALIKENELIKFGKERKCLLCGAEIGRGSTYCVKCSKEVQRKTERPSREELKEMIYTLPFTSIGKQFGVTDNAIRKWCVQYGLPTKKSEIKNFTKEQWEKI